MNYQAQIYRGEGRSRWAVLDLKTRTWIFPARTGYAAAQKKAAELNKYTAAQ